MQSLQKDRTHWKTEESNVDTQQIQYEKKLKIWWENNRENKISRKSTYTVKKSDAG